MKEQREIADLTIQLLPGLFTEATPRASINRWKDGDKVRFHNKLPQKIGGWLTTGYTLADATQPLIGNPRLMKTWVTLNGQEMTAFGTGAKLYIINQNKLYDITPTRRQLKTVSLTDTITAITQATTAQVTINTVSVANPYAAGRYVAITGVAGMTQINGLIGYVLSVGGASGAWTITVQINSSGFGAYSSGGIIGNGPIVTLNASTSVTILDPGHGANVGDYLYISSSTAVGGVTLQGQYQVITANYGSFTVTASGAAGSTAQGGGGTILTYDINAGLDSPGFFYGWGSGTWGTGTWGTPRGVGASTMVQPVRIWSLDNWGQSLMASYRDGPVFYWDANKGFNNHAVLISQPSSFVSGSSIQTTGPPINNQHVLVSPESQQLICLGSNHDGVNDNLFVAVSDIGDYTTFNPTSTNNAFNGRLSSGSKIVTGIRTRSNIILFTDTGVYLMQGVQSTDVFTINQIAENNSILSPNAGIEIDGTIYLMGFRKFFKYDGTYSEIQCDVWSKVWNDFNYSLPDKVTCFQNDFFSEVWWLYCSQSATECNRYVVYNYRENTWTYGSIDRTCGVRSTKSYGFPLAVDSLGTIWQHENGTNDGTNPIDSWIQTYDLQAAENVYRTSGYMWGGDPSGLLSAGTTGVEQIHLSKFVPDMVTQVGNVFMTISAKTYPSDLVYKIKGPYTIKPNVQFISVRARGRIISLKYESTALNDNWRMGQHTFETQADGER